MPIFSQKVQPHTIINSETKTTFLCIYKQFIIYLGTLDEAFQEPVPGTSTESSGLSYAGCADQQSSEEQPAVADEESSEKQPAVADEDSNEKQPAGADKEASEKQPAGADQQVILLL